MNATVANGDITSFLYACWFLFSVDDSASEVDMHPEKRVKAAYIAFEEKNLPLLKVEYPNLRLSQLKQMLKKDWVRSPENPLNQRLLNQTPWLRAT